MQMRYGQNMLKRSHSYAPRMPGLFIHTGRTGPSTRTLLNRHPHIQIISGEQLLALIRGAPVLVGGSAYEIADFVLLLATEVSCPAIVGSGPPLTVQCNRRSISPSQASRRGSRNRSMYSTRLIGQVMA
jgi:hypothetical protein